MRFPSLIAVTALVGVTLSMQACAGEMDDPAEAKAEPAAEAQAAAEKAAPAQTATQDVAPGVKFKVDTSGQDAASSSAELETLRGQLMQKIPGMRREDVRPSPVPGLYEIQRGHMFAYVSGDGKYLIQGDLVNIATGEEITENRRRDDRLAALKTLGEKNMIEFAPPAPIKTKYWVTVFTDIDCGYCRKLHNEMKGYNDRGIGIRYLFFPRSGPNTPSFKAAEAVWCSDDRRDALTRAKRGEKIESKKQCETPVMAEYNLAEELGIRGTPALILPDGDLQPGYVPAPVLAARLAEAKTATP